MRGAASNGGPTATFAALALAVVLAACNDGKELAPVPGHDGVTKSAASERALRRAFDGAPPVIPHAAFGPCVSCHSDSGMAVEGVGFSPPSPHARTKGMSAVSRCQQCHVFQTTRAVFADNGFDGLRQDLRRGRRLNALAPPVIPHQILMRENCQACHSGPTAREEIRTSHPERARCRQCHVEQRTTEVFETSGP